MVNPEYSKIINYSPESINKLLKDSTGVIFSIFPFIHNGKLRSSHEIIISEGANYTKKIKSSKIFNRIMTVTVNLLPVKSLYKS